MRHQQEIDCIACQDRHQGVNKIRGTGFGHRRASFEIVVIGQPTRNNGHSPPANIFPMLELSTPVQYVKGIGPRLAEVLGAKGIHTVDDLLHYLPFRYEDRLNPRGIAELRGGEMATVIAEVRNSGFLRTRRMPIFQMTASQGRARLKCIWFNASYLRDRFKTGQRVALYGKVEEDLYKGGLQLVQPEFELLDDGEDGSAEGEEKKVGSG